MVGGVGDEHLSAVGAVLDGRDAGTPLARRRGPCHRLREAEPGEEGGGALVGGQAAAQPVNYI